MSHRLNFTAKGASMFSRKEVPWHGLGQVLNKDIVTAKEALEASRLNYTVSKAPIAVILEDGDFITKKPTVFTSAKHFATYRTDTEFILGTVGADYTIVQNVDCLAFLDSIIKDYGGTFETAGALGDGERIFITVSMPGDIRINGIDDSVVKYLFITNAHDGSGKVIVAFTTTRIVCNNTLQLAIRDAKHKIAIKHSSSVHDRLELAKMVMAEQMTYFGKIEEVFNRLVKIPVKTEDVRRLMCNIILTDQENAMLNEINYQYNQSRFISTKKCNILDDIFNTIESGIGQEYHRGTALWLVNGITSYYQNTRDYKNNDTKLAFVLGNKYMDNISRAVNNILTTQTV